MLTYQYTRSPELLFMRLLVLICSSCLERPLHLSAKSRVLRAPLLSFAHLPLSIMSMFRPSRTIMSKGTARVPAGTVAVRNRIGTSCGRCGSPSLGSSLQPRCTHQSYNPLE